ncbi:hypothetical protein NJC40_27895 [Pseudomonas sp. 21LCFQ02]|uniref:hypothetical protein n=1 Tax=Pseudomonas sp. 21LCFQ02 TaxID=2957505 RepID=UPI00209B1A99|nr:hypothetical protein [Pseudomonas sp. 21LCFQ02]MCO8171594.1 hypothetical protein [Pseudomonas sp. 21LCFQ02]
MNSKPVPALCLPLSPLDLAAAVEDFVAQGGVIAIIPQGETAEPVETAAPASLTVAAPEKLQLLRLLAAKGAGVSSLQYSLKMNRKDIRQLAQQHDIKINFSRPIQAQRNGPDTPLRDIDDVTAGHAMHYSSLGHSTAEIARILGLSVREILDIGKAYRFEFSSHQV